MPFLEALARECVLEDPDLDIHIAHAGPWPGGAQAAKLNLHPCPAASSIFGLWGAAIAQADTDYVAVLDVQVPPAPGWFARVRHEIALGTSLFFGAVQPGWGDDDIRAVGYLAEYAQFHAPLRAGLSEVPGNNLVGQRNLFAAQLGAGGFDKTILLRRVGLAPAPVEGMPVIYRKGFALRRYLRNRVRQGRAFAAARHGDPGQPPRWLCIAFTPFLPLLRAWRIHRATGDRPELRRAARRWAHVLLLSEIAWSWGELLGYASPAAGR